jgi:hypothetical protein
MTPSPTVVIEIARAKAAELIAASRLRMTDGDVAGADLLASAASTIAMLCVAVAGELEV